MIVVHISSSSGFRDSSAPSSNGITGNTGGTEKPAATGNDEILPDSSSKFFFDCGRDPKKGNRLLCVPDGKLCSESKIKIIKSFDYLKFNLIISKI